MTGRYRQHRIIGILAVTQIVSWGSVYYAFSVLAAEIQHELGWRTELIFGAFSWSLLVAGAISTPAGILLDRIGGRVVMGTGSLVAGLGLLLLSTTQSEWTYFAAWTLLGAAMALVLYEAAFATINREFIANARVGISTLTLFGGFASTVFWPLTLYLNDIWGWRDTYFAFGVLHLVLCLPAHLLLPVQKTRAPAASMPHGVTNYTLRQALAHAAFWKLAIAFATNAFIFAALSVHLIPLLHRLGHSVGTAVMLAALIGPMQVAGRIGEMVFARRAQPQAVGKITFATLPVALLALISLGEQQWVAALFCILYGLSNGILTIVRGTVPQALFGRENYGAISGALAGPALLAKASGPLALATMMAASGSVAPWLALLFVIAVTSFICYVAAVRAPVF